MNRRGFMRAAALAAGAGLAAACDQSLTTELQPSFAKGGNGKGGGGGGGGGGGTTKRNPLKIPLKQAPGDLSVGDAVVDVGGEQLSNVWGYNGQFPAPTFVAQTGDQVTLRLTNNLGDETITHWHGMIVDTKNDGHPRDFILPGASYDYDFPIIQRATMNWYHPHPHEKTGEQVAMGLAGAFIIRDAEEAALALPDPDGYEIPLIIRDAEFDRQGNMLYKPRSGGFEGKTPLVNGTLDPYLSVGAAVYRLRILNGCNARILRLALSTGTFTLIGNDGGLLKESVPNMTEFLISPAERLDVLVDLRGVDPGSSVMLQDLNAGWDLLEFRVEAEVTAQDVIRTDVAVPLSDVPELVVPPDLTVREFSFDGMSKINGKIYDMADDGFTVPFHVPEIWRFTTNGNAPHPVHVHGAYFRVVGRTGGRGTTYPWEQGWKDTVLLEDGETVDVLVHFTNYKGLYLMHCHKLEHEDMGMMVNFTVA